MFQPKWKKDAYALLKASQKFVHYKRDLLSESQIDEIKSRQIDLKKAVKSKNQEEVKTAVHHLNDTCDKALPSYRSPGAMAENLEVIFVALVVALGIRTYLVQPFRIPTGSMQPTLNGVIIKQTGEERPNLIVRLADKVWKGRTYLSYTASNDAVLTGVNDASFLFFSRTKLSFSDGSTFTFPAPLNEVLRTPSIRAIYRQFPPQVKQGQTIFKGMVTTGDLVLVDKMSYHFRRPNRGEVFVFNTHGLDTSRKEVLKKRYSREKLAEAGLLDQVDGTHYIKRLCGVPGDTLSIKEPYLYVNGMIAQEEGIRRVMEQKGVYGEPPHKGYELAKEQGTNSSLEYPPEPLGPEVNYLVLKRSDQRGMSEYAALGDNSSNSLDSRYWGTVKEHNLLGPGLFSLWPFGSGHWGFIK